MYLRSILESSKLEVVASKRAVALVYLAFGLAIFAWWTGSLFQFFDAYATYGQFDGPPLDFMLITLLFFLPLLFVGAYMLSSFILRERLLHWLKTRAVMADYSSGLPPAEAGTLIDYEYSLEESWATLLNLHFRGAVHLEPTTGGINVKPGHSLTTNQYESVFLNRLFGRRPRNILLHDTKDGQLIEAGHAAHAELVTRLEALGALRTKAFKSKVLKRIIVTIYCVAGFTAFLQVAGMLFGGDQYWGINYPRYDIHIIQPITLIVMTLISVLILLMAFKPKFTDNYKSTPEVLHLQAAGYYEYLKFVYASRLSLEAIHTQPINEIKLLVPYMLAYKLVRPDIEYIKQVIVLTKDSSSIIK